MCVKKKLIIAFFISVLLIPKLITPQNQKFGLIIHGGAGNIKRENISAEKEKEYVEKLNEALQKGFSILENGGSSLDAVNAAIYILEDSPLFNAGKGSVLTEKGEAELDASIMDGKNLMAGAVAGLKHIKNPINLARLVMEKSPNVFLIGEGAEEFAKQNNFELVPNDYFITEERLNQYKKAKEKLQQSENEKHGTVGCVALDKNGNLAAGTSTGGMMMKKFGRVGDSPIIGAGTYANNNTCAVSATGNGEFFIRLSVAHEISNLIEYKNLSIQDAANELVLNRLKKMNAEGGVIAIDKNGNVATPFNTTGMFRAIYISGEKPIIKIFNN
ncbi:MAG: isoaspartyl peptidase/L-asparaginase family protein [Stygiobacter sp.]